MTAVTVFGAGYVGVVTAACLAECGHHVCGIDTDGARIAALARGELPFHEPGLDPLLQSGLASGRLRFTGNADAAVAHGELIFVAVGTPPGEDGSADLSHVLGVAQCIGERLAHDAVVVVKSTVPPGTADAVRARLTEALRARGRESLQVAVLANPEFLREGSAVRDFLAPERVIVGGDDERALAALRRLYEPLLDDLPRQWLAMDTLSAEFCKYACNAMLAVRISLINELASLAQAMGADIEPVRRGMGMDARIGPHALAPGCGYGGSCLPKDLLALRRGAEQLGQPVELLAATERVNARCKRWLPQRIARHFGGRLQGRRIAVWGLAFKPHTDDLRAAPSAVLLRELTRAGATVVAWDPAAMAAAQREFASLPGLRFARGALAALDGADALAIVTDWPQLRSLAPQAIAQRLSGPVFDGRNLYEPARMAAEGIDYHCVGRPHVTPRRETHRETVAAHAGDGGHPACP